MYEIYANLRDSKGLKDYEICKKIGISPSVMSDWKAGRYNLRAEKLQKIAEYFGVSVDYLMGRGDGSSGSAEAAAPAELTKDEAELLRLFRKLNASGKKKALEWFEDLAALEKYTSKLDASYFSSAG